MLKAWRYCAVVGLVLAVAGGSATAQIPPGADDQAQPGSKPKPKKPPPEPGGPNIIGSWNGQLNQVGSQTPYRVEITINARGAETRYPDQDCTGRLTRVGSARTYAFFVEVITKGQAEKGGRCPDGTLTVARLGDELAVGWFGTAQGNTIIAYGNLSKK